MSSVVVQLGQCGNQVGKEFWALTEQDRSNNRGFVYCSYDGKFRSVNIDSEPKVLGKLLKESRTGHTYREVNIITGRSGRGSNWAFGYHGQGVDSQASLLEETLKIIRKEIERCPSFCGFICMHSLAGGTGSGLGSRLLEVLRDAYPVNYIMSSVVAPYSLGENPLQSYNMLLSLAALQNHSDGILLFENDEVLSKLTRLHQRSCGADVNGVSRTDVKPVSMQQVNQNIASSIAGLFLPTDSLSSNSAGSSGVSIGMEPWELIRTLCSLPTLKFLKADYTCKSKLSWPDLTSSLLRSMQQRMPDGKAFSSVGNVVVVRGDSTSSFVTSQRTIEQQIKTACRTVEWNPFPVDFWTAKSNPFKPIDSASMTMASNSNSVVRLLDSTLSKARDKFDVGAYVHWYQRYGCQKEDFEVAFDVVQNIITAYDDAVL